MKKLAKYLAVFSAVILIIFSAALVVASNLYNSKIQSVISKINSRQHYAVFTYEPLSSSILNKDGLLTVDVSAPKIGNIRTVFRINVDFSFSSIKATFSKVDHEGNIDEFLASMRIPTLKLEGAIAFYPWQLKGSGAVKTSAFTIPIEGGSCRFGENSFYASGRSKTSLDIGFASAGIKCQAYEMYNHKPAFILDLLDLKVTAKPLLDIENKNVSLDKVNVKLDTFLVDTSTIYMIGFGPNDKVRDPSLRDSFKLSSLNLDLSMSDKDYQGRREIASDGSMTIEFALPHEKDSKILPYYDLSDLNYDVTLGNFNIETLLAAARNPEAVDKIIGAISKPLNFNLKNLSFKHAGSNVSTSGRASVILDPNSGKPQNVDATIHAKADRAFVDSLVSAQYEQGLFDLMQSGAVTLKHGVYSTTLAIKGKDISLNGVTYNAAEDKNEAEFTEKSLDE
ncbi:hypothetical protein SAMN02745213_01874 [Succinivibrio dextrinosolvens DSM 3072]|uniref:Uncharacterized protein n=1 Tax=Succinivibrio dextrinosolvens DSM 3072 TaxID=1123324 RepID=A0A1T4VPF6_9GAMM|nr:hypothetical protein [Succinivibrio dextrinosolvens]SKA66840.1 hypothetical protein SAMN02745213_01874 [Succinivibrio dextrinosolvens DSM 3072]